MIRYSWILMLGLLCFIKASAQQPLLRNYTVNDGLPSNTVYNAFQDSKGFIWFCTDWGVSRFDGHHFETISSRDGLPHNEIFLMMEDPWKRLWLVSYGGKPCYIINDKVYSSANDALCRRIEEAGIRYQSITYNANNELCFIGNEVYVLHRDSLVRSPAHLYSATPMNVFPIRNIDYYINGEELFHVRKGTKTVLLSDTFSGSVGFANHIFSRVFLPKNNHLSEDYFYDIDLSKQEMKAHLIKVGYKIIWFAPARYGKIWCCTEGGALVYDPEKRMLDTQIRLKGFAVNNIFTDKRGNSWFLTAKNGVYLQPARMVSSYTKPTLSGDNVHSLCFIPGQGLLVGYDKGNVDLLKHNEIKHYKLAGEHWNRVMYLVRINDNEVLAGTDKGLFTINLDNGEIRVIKKGAQKSGFFRNGYFLLGYSGVKEMIIYDTDKREFIAKPLAIKAMYKTITATAIDTGQTYWLGTLEGLYHFDKDSVYKWEYDNILSHSHITSLAVLEDNTLVIGTHSSGVYLWTGKKLVRISSGQGLVSDICRKVHIDERERIWVNTDRGIDIITLDKKMSYGIYHLSSNDGISTHTINDIAFGEGKAYLATQEGILSISQDYGEIASPSKVQILSVTTKDSIQTYPAAVTLKYNENNLQVNYTSISFTDKDIVYKYLLAGNSKDTITTSQATLNISGLKPGNYQLLLWAVSKNNAWSMEPARLTITVTPPFWAETWFILLFALILLILIAWIYKKRVGAVRKNEKEAAERKRKIAGLEMQALRAQINPHFMFNALNAIQNYYNQNDERSANYYLSTFSRLIRQTLTYSKEHWITIEEEMSVHKSYIELEQMRFKYSFTYEIIVAPDLLQVKVPSMLLQVYIENAINHGLRHLDRPGKLVLSCAANAHNVICRIEDNGVGFEQAARLDSRLHKHESMGMRITEERIATINELYNTHIEVKITDRNSLAEKGEGVVIEIIIPKSTQYEPNKNYHY